MGLSLRGQTSGAIDINAPNVAGDNTITLPGTNGAANQFYKNSGTAGIVTHSSMVEDSSGLVGIGSDNPETPLNVLNNNANTPTVWIRNTSTGGDSPALRVQGGANNDNAVGTFEVRDYDGNVDFKVGGTSKVGVGTNNPVSTLDVNGIISSRGRYIIDTQTDVINIGGIVNSASLGISTIRFFTSDIERMRVTDNGLTFNGDTAAANALDDYEEGTWTPLCFANGSESTGAAYGGNNGGSYVKIGRMVYVHCRIELTSNGSSSGAFQYQIGGLPFTVGGAQSGNSSLQGGGVPSYITGGAFNLTGTFDYVGCVASQGTNRLDFYKNTISGANLAQVTLAEMGNTSSFIMEASYPV